MKELLEKMYYHFYNLLLEDKLDYYKWEDFKDTKRKFEY